MRNATGAGRTTRMQLGVGGRARNYRGRLVRGRCDRHELVSDGQPLPRTWAIIAEDTPQAARHAVAGRVAAMILTKRPLGEVVLYNLIARVGIGWRLGNPSALLSCHPSERHEAWHAVNCGGDFNGCADGVGAIFPALPTDMDARTLAPRLPA